MDRVSSRGSLSFPTRIGYLRASGRRAVMTIDEGSVSLTFSLVTAAPTQPVTFTSPPGIDFGQGERGWVAVRPRGANDWHFFRDRGQSAEVLSALASSGAADPGQVKGPPGVLESPPVRGPWPWLLLGAGLACLALARLLPTAEASWFGNIAPGGLVLGAVFGVAQIASRHVRPGASARR